MSFTLPIHDPRQVRDDPEQWRKVVRGLGVNCLSRYAADVRREGA